MLNAEWDNAVLETFELRKHLDIVKKQLVHAMYQQDAATRVISRLIKERDEARKALANTQQRLSDFKTKLDTTVVDTKFEPPDKKNEPPDKKITPRQKKWPPPPKNGRLNKKFIR